MKYILGADSITVYYKGNMYPINRQAQTFGLVLQAIQANDEVALEKALNIRQAIVDRINTAAKGTKVRIDGNRIFYETREITGLIASRVFEMIRLSLDVTPMLKFIENLMQNPSKRAVDELFGFMEACTLPITEDGHFLAYKRVRSDYKDVHSGTLDNSVGNTLEMPRNLVDEDKNNTCSYGLHFCSYDYLKHFSGERIVVLKINPADVVAIPADYNNSKGRTCRYEVVDELPLNEYNLPQNQLEEGYTQKYSDVDTPEVPMQDGYDDSDVEYLSSYIESYVDEDDDAPVQVDRPVNITGNKIDENDVREIRKFFDSGNWTIEDLMDAYDLSRRQIKRIVNRESWKHVV